MWAASLRAFCGSPACLSENRAVGRAKDRPAVQIGRAAAVRALSVATTVESAADLLLSRADGAHIPAPVTDQIHP